MWFDFNNSFTAAFCDELCGMILLYNVSPHVKHVAALQQLQPVADPGFGKGGGDYGERVPKRGSGGRALSRVQGQSPRWWVSAAESFLSIFMQKVAKS